MFFNIRGKIVRSVVFGNEVKIRDRSRVEDSKKRVFPWVTDGCGGKSIQEISIIWSGF